MEFREELEGGELGLRFVVPASARVLEEGRRTITFVDPERRVAWRVTIMPFRFDLRKTAEDPLRADIERSLRREFAESHAERRREKKAKGGEPPPATGPFAERPPRTDDPAWSPIIDFKRTRIDEARALTFIFRSAYEPGHEIIVARTMIPIEAGTVEIDAITSADRTGLRESTLMLMAGTNKADPEAAAKPQFLSQAEYDAVGHDALFVEHPLSKARASLAWLVDQNGGELEVTAPMPESPRGEIELPQAGCAVTAPPRFVVIPPGVMPMMPTVAMFTRVGYTVRDIVLLDVGKMPGKRITTGARGAALSALAVRHIEGWAAEGCSEIETRAKVLPDEDGRVQVQCFARYRVGEKLMHSATRWFLADEDGQLFRVSVGGARHNPKKELIEEAESVVRSWRRLPGDVVKPTPWWRFW